MGRLDFRVGTSHTWTRTGAVEAGVVYAEDLSFCDQTAPSSGRTV